MLSASIITNGWVLGVYNIAAEGLQSLLCKGWDGDQTCATHKLVEYWTPKIRSLVTMITGEDQRTYFRLRAPSNLK